MASRPTRSAKPTKAKPTVTPRAKASSAKTARPKSTKPAKTAKSASAPEPEIWTLRLYVTGQTPKSVEAFANLKRICEEHLHGRYVLEVVDLMREPALARGDQILAVPTLVRRLPQPVKKLIGDLSNTERVLVGLNLRPWKTSPCGE